MSASDAVLWALAHELRSPIGIVDGVVAHGLEDEELSGLASQGTRRLAHLCRCVEALATNADRFEAISLRRALRAAETELAVVEPRRAARLRFEDGETDVTAWGPSNALAGALVQLLSQVIRMDEGPFTLRVTDDALEIRGPEGALSVPSPDASASRLVIAAALFAPMTRQFSLEEDGTLLRWVPLSRDE